MAGRNIESQNIEIRDANSRLLSGFDCDIPLHQTVLLTGPSGAGQRELLFDVLWEANRNRWQNLGSFASLRAKRESANAIVRGLAMAVAPRRMRARMGDTIANCAGVALPLAQFFWRFGNVACPACGKVAVHHRRQEILQWVANNRTDSNRLMFFIEIRATARDEYLHRGFSRVLVVGAENANSRPEFRRLEDVDPSSANTEQLVLDYFRLSEGWQGRLLELLSLATQIGSSTLFTLQIDGSGQDRLDSLTRQFSELPFCVECRKSVIPAELKSLLRFPAKPSVGLDLGAQLLTLHQLAGIQIADCLPRLSSAAAAVLSRWRDSAGREDAMVNYGERLMNFVELGLQTLIDLGLGYLNLSRPFGSLSHGERERVLVARQLARRLRGALYLFDEPSRGLHEQDINRLLSVFRKLREHDCSLCVVDHNPGLVGGADYELSFSRNGGANISVDYAGTPRRPVLLTEKQVRESTEAPPVGSVQTSEWFSFGGLTRHNLVDVSVRFPKQALTCCIGVSGSGKSTLMLQCVAERTREMLSAGAELSSGDGTVVPASIRRIISLNQRGRVASGAATVVSFLSLNSWLLRFFERLPEARLLGWDVRRLREALRTGDSRMEQIRWRGFTLPEILHCFVHEIFPHAIRLSFLRGRLQLLKELGLEYLRLDDRLRDLAPGELTRLRLARAIADLSERETLLLADEPLLGLNQAECVQVMKRLRGVVKAGHTVIVIEHSPVALHASDFVVEMGPGAGADGGRVVSAGWLGGMDNGKTK